MINETNNHMLLEINQEGEISLTPIDPDEIEDFELCDIMRGGIITNRQIMLAIDDNGEICDISDHLDHGTLFADNL